MRKSSLRASVPLRAGVKPAKQGRAAQRENREGRPACSSSRQLTMFRFLRTQKRIEDLEETMERIDSAFKKLQVEWDDRSEEHTSELQSLTNLVCRLLLEKKKKKK